MKGFLSPKRGVRGGSDSRSPVKVGGREPLLPPASALGEGLSVLVCDVEEHADDAARAIGDVGGLRRVQGHLARARHSLEELRKQARSCPRGKLQSFLLQHRLESLFFHHFATQ